jgi:hypothetical protein
MAAKTSEGRTVSIPRRSVEIKGSPPGKVITRQATPEELAYYRSLPKPGERKRPITKHSEMSSEEQKRRAEVRYQKQQEEDADMGQQRDVPSCGLTREILLEQVAAGESLASIEKAWGMKYNTIHNWVKRWGLKGIKAEQAHEMIEQAKQLAAQNVHVVNQPPIAPVEQLLREKDVAPLDVAEEVGWFKERLREIDEMQKMTAKATEEAAILRNQVTSLEMDIKSYQCKEQDLLNQIKGLQEEINEWIRNDLNRAETIADAKQQILELQYQLAHQAKEAGQPVPGIVTLTYALLDFGGNRDDQRQKCIEEADEYSDEIEAANIDLTRAVSELYDAGQAFVGLIRKQFQELLVDDTDGAVQQYFQKHNDRHMTKMSNKKAGTA